MKILEIEINAEEIKALKPPERSGGILDKILNVLAGPVVEEETEEETVVMETPFEETDYE